MDARARCSPAADDAFGPRVNGCRNDFDFTLYFEQLILTILPACVFVAIVPFRVRQLYRQELKVVRGPLWLRSWRWSALAFLGAIQLAILIQWSTSSHAPKTAIAASTVGFVCSLGLIALSALEYSRSVRPSALIIVFLALSIILDLAQARTLWFLRSGGLHYTFTLGVLAKFALLAIECVEKKRFLKSPYRSLPPETLGSTINRAVFWWINRLLLKGNRSVLSAADLYTTDPELSSATLRKRISRAWNANQETGRSLMSITLQCFWPQLFSAVFARLLIIGFRFSQPLLIRRAITVVESPETPENKDVSSALIGATALIYLGLAFMTAQYKHKIYRTMTMIRGALTSLIYDRTLLLDSDAANDSAAVTHMSTDIERIMEGLERSDSLWASPIEIGIAIFLLWRELGLACLAPVVLTFLATFGSFIVGKFAIVRQKLWVDATQERVSATASALQAIKSIKMLGLEEIVATRLQQLRDAEVDRSKGARKVRTMANTISNTALFLTTPLTFLVYVLIQQSSGSIDLNMSTAFTSLSLIMLLSRPLQELAFCVPLFTASLGCYGRIEAYLRKSKPDTQPEDDGGHTVQSREGIPMSDIHNVGGPNGSSDISLGLTDATFRFPGSHAVALKDLTVQIPPRKLTVVSGSVGCGKSTLLRALTGQLEIVSGSRSCNTEQIAYCSQTSWLPNTTIRKAIIGPNAFDEQWYLKVLQSCMLDDDLTQFENGDETMIGSQGAVLSGGQKQRVAFARAIYSRNKLLVLDDIFSGLDANTLKSVFQRALGPNGLCTRYEATVVLATHSSLFIHAADNIISMTNGGCIKEQGPPATLTLSSIQNTPKDSASEEPSDSPQQDAVEKLVRRDPVQDDSAADLARQSGDMRMYAYYFGSIGVMPTAVYLLFLTAVLFGAMFQGVWLKLWSEAESREPNKHTWQYLGGLLGLGFMSEIGIIFGLLALYLLMAPRASVKIHRRLLTAVFNSPYHFFVDVDNGVTLNRFSQDMSLIDVDMPTGWLQTSDGALAVLFSAILILIVSKYMAAFVPGLIVVLYFLQRFYLRTSRQMRFLDLEAKSPLYTNFLETLGGLNTIKAFKWQNAWRSQNLAFLDSSQKPFYLLYCIQRWLNFVLDMTVAAVAVIVMTLATQLPHQTSGGYLGLALTNLVEFSTTLAYLITAWTQLETSIGAVARVSSFEKSTRREDPQAHLLETVPANWPERGEIIFGNTSSCYSLDSEPVLRNLNLHILPGQKVGICGRTGSGKSSFLLTLLRMTEITNGTVTIDGVDTQLHSRQDIRSRITSIAQDTFVLSGSVRFNADPSLSADESDIEEALRKVGLWEIVVRCGGLDSQMAELRLSHGQQQLFSLARALLRRSKILILDEATSNVDKATEETMMRIIKEDFGDATTLAVAHRLNTIADYDRVIVLDRGVVVEFDSPHNLLQRDSIFRELYEKQH